MRPVLGTFGHLWPSQNKKALEVLIGTVKFVNYPEEKEHIAKIRDPDQHVVIMSDSNLVDVMSVISLGFEHVVQKYRPDFAQELLTSCLMISRPKTFLQNPIPLVLPQNFSPEINQEIKEQSDFILGLTSSESKSFVLAELEDFLKKSPRNHAITELCIQAADEIMTNAIYNAPTNDKGEYLYQKTNRNELVTIPDNKAAKFFCSFSEYRVLLGCIDQYGSLQKKPIKEHLTKVLSTEKVRPKNSFSAGAGVGLRFVAENASNFYLYCEKGRRSFVGCGFITGGMRVNLTEHKHFHISIH